MTIMIHFHQASYRTFKTYYTDYAQVHLQGEFLHPVSYNRFIQLLPRVVLGLWAYAQSRCGRCTGIAFVDSTPLRVCTNRRITRHTVFKGLAARGQCSLGLFYGFRLHLIVSKVGEVLAFTLMPRNIDDRRPVPQLVQWLFSCSATKATSPKPCSSSCGNRDCNSSPV